jgi:hypothetical protein
VDKNSIVPLRIFVDGLALVYHEARNVRHLIKKGYLEPDGWEEIIKLPGNRREAWKQLQTLRGIGKESSLASQASARFAAKFGRSVDELITLYQNPNWRHAAGYGGHKWIDVTEIVRDLGSALEEGRANDASVFCNDLIASSHNNGLVRDKIRRMDESIEVNTDPWWNG